MPTLVKRDLVLKEVHFYKTPGQTRVSIFKKNLIIELIFFTSKSHIRKKKIYLGQLYRNNDERVNCADFMQIPIRFF